MASYIAVKVYGPGHVIAYNYVANFHDGIDIETYGNPDGSAAVDGPKYPTKEYWDKRPVSIDFYNNYMTNFHDNPFEADGGMHNVRVMRNMMINSASHAFCNQPAIRRAGVLDRQHRVSPAGRIDPAHQWIGGRVLLPQHHPVGDRRAGQRRTCTGGTTCFSAKTARRPSSASTPSPATPRRTTTASGPTRALNSRSSGTRLVGGVRADYTDADHRAALDTRQFQTLAAYAEATGQDRHSVLVDYDVFVNVPRLDAQDIRTVQKVYKAEDFDFRLRPASAAVDRGIALPNVNDGFTGQAPDLGALEGGEEEKWNVLCRLA